MAVQFPGDGQIYVSISYLCPLINLKKRCELG